MDEIKSKETMMESVCTRCPGSMWGSKSICRVHGVSIGQVEFCPEWDKAVGGENAEADLAESGEEADQAMEQVQRMEEALKDYHWMTREIDRIRTSLTEIGGNVTAGYGTEASQPKAKGSVRDPVQREVQKRGKLETRLRRLEHLVARIDSASESIATERERTVLACLLEGQRMNAIASHLGVSRQRLHEIKRGLVRKMAKQVFEETRGAS